MTIFSIKDLAHFSGIKPHTIRIWEQRFAFLQPERNEGLRRRYTTEELNTFLDVALLNQNGFKVSQIARMTGEEKRLRVSQVRMKEKRMCSINELIICMAEMNTRGFEAVIDSCFEELGIDETVCGVIYPFLNRVGLLHRPESKSYTTNIFLVKEILHRKMIFAIEHLQAAVVPSSKVLLFLPPDEQQELALLYLNYRMKKDGVDTFHLGADLPVQILDTLIALRQPDFVITQFCEKRVRSEWINFAETLESRHPGLIFISLGQPLVTEGNGTACRHAEDLDDALSIVYSK